MKTLSAQEIAELIDGTVTGDSGMSISKAAGLKEAGKDAVSFVSNERYLAMLKDTKAGIVIIPREVTPPSGITVVACDDSSRGFTAVVNALYPSQRRSQEGIAPGVEIPASSKLGDGVYVGPNTIVSDDVTIGSGTQILGNVSVGTGVTIGSDCWIFPGVVLYEGTEIGNRCAIHANSVVGSDGFGYLEETAGARTKIPQVGIVVIEDDVEIGANCAIDRARFETTRIGSGTKIDNLVQIAHNVKIGSNTVVVSQAGISGSSEIGDQVVIAGQVGIVGHIKIGSRSMIGAKSGVAKSVNEGSRVSGYYAADHRQTMKELASLRKLPAFMSETKKKLKEEKQAD